MAAGPGLAAFPAFVAVKFAGYSLAAVYLNRVYRKKDQSALRVGLARTGLGIAVGVPYGATWMWLPLPPFLFLPLLIPIRMVEWGLLLKWFYEREFLATSSSLKRSAAGTVWSFALDAVGVAAAFVVPGGIWVC